MTDAMREEMKAWVELAKPGEHHAHLDPFVGRWRGRIKMWMAPGAPVMEHESTAEAKWILDGRYLEWLHTGTFDGTPFEGRGIDGFNNGMDRYESVWVDNFGTLVLFYTGSCEGDGRLRTLTTTFAGPAAGATVSQRVVYTWTGEDAFTYESFMTQGDDEHRNVLIEYTRIRDEEGS